MGFLIDVSAFSLLFILVLLFVASEAGNVGIGKTGAATALDVNGTIKGAGYQSTSAMVDMPPSPVGWFYRKDESLVTQLGTVAYFALVGNVCVWEPRRNGQLYNIDGIE